MNPTSHGNLFQPTIGLNAATMFEQFMHFIAAEAIECQSDTKDKSNLFFPFQLNCWIYCALFRQLNRTQKKPLHTFL